MNSLDILTRIYKPYKVIIKGKSNIFKCSSGEYVIKKKNDRDIKELYKYLASRNFLFFPKLIEDNRSDYLVYEYIEDSSLDNEQKLIDLITLVSLLHNKTCYYKEITNDKVKDIYEQLLGRVEYMEEYFNRIIFEIEDNVFISPSGYLLINNSSKLFESFTFLKKEIEEWYKLAIDSNKMRVALVHNNLDIDHYIKSKDEYLISWDNYIIDSPIIDIVKLYKKVYINMDFSEPLKIYLEKFPLNNQEKKLLFIMLVMPDELNLENNELNNVKCVREFLDYVFKTENLIKTYYV